MSSSRVQRKRKLRSSKLTPEEILKAEEEAEDEALLELAEDEQALLDSEDEPEPEEVKKEYYGTAGAKSWEELDQVKAVQEQAKHLQKTSYAAQDMVWNILYDQNMSPKQKAGAIKSVADGFESRATMKSIMEKESDSSPLKRVVTQVKNAFDKLSGKPTYEDGGLLIEKDLSGSWRWVGWPSNKWIDREGEILRESAHEEYVEWVNKNMDAAPMFASWHIPGSSRENPVDYVGYIDGFLVMSGKLNDYEAQGLLEMQKEVDLGLSLGGICWFDKEETNVVNRYRCYEVSDLPLEKAANPFTEFTILEKEASMNNKQEYIEKLASFMPEDRQQAFLEKTQLKKEQLEDAQVEAKEVTPEEAETQEQSFNYEEVKEQLLKELDVEGLSAFVQTAQEAIEKVPILEAAVETLSKSNEELKKESDEKLAEMIAAPAKFPWSQRASQSKDTELEKDNEEDETLEKAVPNVHWLNEQTNTQPLTH